MVWMDLKILKQRSQIKLHEKNRLDLSKPLSLELVMKTYKATQTVKGLARWLSA